MSTPAAADAVATAPAATATARTTVPTTETGTGPHRAMSRGGSAEEQIDPTAQQATISPNRDELRDSSSDSVGYQSSSEV